MNEKQPGARLLARTGGFADVTHTFENEASLGRSAGNDVRLNSPYLSSRHARIYFKDGEYYIEDLGSRNGTRVDGVAVVRPVCLERVNVISLADTVDLVFIRSVGASRNSTESSWSAAGGRQQEMNTAPSVAPRDAVQSAPRQGRPAAPASPPATSGETRYDIAFPVVIDPRAGGVRLPSPPAAAVHELELTHADGRKQIFPLKTGNNVLGRSDTCDVVLPDPGKWLSRQHATLSIQPDGVTLIDHGTMNGTFIGGQRIRSVSLEPGTAFRVGPELELRLIRR